MFYTYRTLSAMDQHLRPSYRFGAIRTNHPSKIGEILQHRLGKAIRQRVLKTYFFKESLKHDKKILTYALRYDPPTRMKGVKVKTIRGFVEVEQVSWWNYCKVKVHHFWSYWIKNNTPCDESEIFME